LGWGGCGASAATARSGCGPDGVGCGTVKSGDTGVGLLWAAASGDAAAVDGGSGMSGEAGGVMAVPSGSPVRASTS
jgi:hypothetical protein